MKWGNLFDISSKKAKISELEQLATAPDFWNDTKKAKEILQQTKSLTDLISNYNNLVYQFDDLVTFLKIALEENDDSILDEVKNLKDTFFEDYENLKIATFLNSPYDKNNAILTLHSGAGGTEACDWVSMLLRMYLRWAEKHGFSYQELDFLAGEEAGIKSVTMLITGENAYGYLKSEKGIHRLVRISPFDASGKRHTSFASCDVIPEITQDINFEINPDDLRIDTFRASGAGGQHVNKTSSAIRITHLPTNIVVQCQNERSQLQNKEQAMKMLKSKLYNIKLEEQQSRLASIRGEVKEIAWGSQIRSYVFHPYSLVKDHRTNTEATNYQAVMDGDIDVFINSFLSQNFNN